MKTTMKHIHDPSHISGLPLQSEHKKKVQIYVYVKAVITVILITVLAIAGWRMYAHVVSKNDNQTSVVSSPIATLQLTETLILSPKASPPSISNQTFDSNLVRFNKKLFQMDAAIRQFMDQQMAIEQLFRNVTCSRDVNEWYSFIVNSKPTIDMDIITKQINLNVDHFEHEHICNSSDGWITYIGLDGIGCSGVVDLTSLPKYLEVLRLDANSFTGTVDLTSLPESLQELTLSHNTFRGFC